MALSQETLEAFDVETWGKQPAYALQPFRAGVGQMILHNGERQAWLTSCAWAIYVNSEPRAAGTMMPNVDSMQHLLERWVRQGRWVVCWNAPFDVAWLIAYGLRELVYKVNWLDGLLIHRALNNYPRYKEEGRESMSLKAVTAKRWPERAGYEEDVDFGASTAEELAKLLHYNMQDCVNTLELTWENLQRMTPAMRRNMLIEAASIPMVAETLITGIAADGPAAEALSLELENKAKEAFVRLRVLGGLAMEADELQKVLASPKKLADLLYNQWGLPVLKHTETGAPSTDKEVLTELAATDNRAKYIHEYREALNNRTKFAEGTLASLAYNGDGKVRPGARVFGTYCVPGDVEVLTRGGWEPLHSWAGGEIAQVHPDRRIEFLPADRFVGPVVDEWVTVEHQGLQCRFTHGHTVPYLSQKYLKWCATTAGELLGAGVRHFPVAGNATLDGRLTSDQMRVLAMAQADGWFDTRRGVLKFTLKKQRKVERARRLLAALDIRTREYVASAYPERTEIRAYDLPPWLTPACKHLGPWLLDTTHDGLSAFVDEVEHWDGSRKDGGVVYSSSIRANAEWVATAAALVGRKASLHAKDGPTWPCRISDGAAYRTIVPTRHVREVRHPARAYCATTHTGFWLARSQGGIFITGNTGRMTYSSKVKG